MDGNAIERGVVEQVALHGDRAAVRVLLEEDRGLVAATGGQGVEAVPGHDGIERRAFQADGVGPAAAQTGERVVLDLRGRRPGGIVDDHAIGALSCTGDVRERVVLDDQAGA